MARKTLNAYTAMEAGQGADIGQHIPVMRTLQKSLRAIEEIDPDLIDDWGPIDRLDEGVTAVTPEETENSFEHLRDLIREHGQQVPVLLRPSKSNTGRFEIIFGRRRLRACRDLGIHVKANIQEMDDDTALMAKGLENAGRRGLSFYEKARFAEEIAEQDYTAAQVGSVLGVDRTAIQHFRRVTKAVPRGVGVMIGAAPGSGRPKWIKLAEAFEKGQVTTEHALVQLNQMADLTSDQRLDALLKDVAKRGAAHRVSNERSPLKGVTIKSGQGVSVSVKKGAFADWLDRNLDEVLRKAHQEFKATSKTEE
ncbi:plasmid partitioning protein RepB [Phaeobacter sp. JH20_36]|uniref:plasmid partitioning protein RepB n=1 Tax=unclassified Phaeobacter TaxID=2621772 RepID=UPI003A8941D6